jgi:hypothetical protein
MSQQYTKSLRLIPTKHPHVFNVQLCLNAETRYIGTLDEAGEGTFYTKRSEKHVFRKLNALGLSLELLQRSDFHFNWIVIEYCGRELVTSRMFFLYHGSVFNFYKVGFEKQCFLKLDGWGRERAETFERTITKQGELFAGVAA